MMGNFVSTSTARIDPDEKQKKDRLVETFDQFFEIIPANSLRLLEEVHKLRYQVYCCENAFENPASYPDCREMDAYDARSVHSLLVDKASGDSLGTVRIILPDSKHPSKSFPIQEICRHQFLSERRLTGTITAVEVSRFAISKKCRNEWNLRKEMSLGEPTTAMAQLMALGLIKASVRMSVEHGISEWFAVMEPSLLRLFKRFGMYFRPIGPLVEYHGFRQPCHAHLYNLLERVRAENLGVWEVITDEGKYVDHEKESVRLTS